MWKGHRYRCLSRQQTSMQRFNLQEGYVCFFVFEIEVINRKIFWAEFLQSIFVFRITAYLFPTRARKMQTEMARETPVMRTQTVMESLMNRYRWDIVMINNKWQLLLCVNTDLFNSYMIGSTLLLVLIHSWRRLLLCYYRSFSVDIYCMYCILGQPC